MVCGRGSDASLSGQTDQALDTADTDAILGSKVTLPCAGGERNDERNLLVL
jgi:hypothetical protein